jgi:hypothetical protein
MSHNELQAAHVRIRELEVDLARREEQLFQAAAREQQRRDSEALFGQFLADQQPRVDVPALERRIVEQQDVIERLQRDIQALQRLAAGQRATPA